jgi:hypothetical protein
MLAYHSIGGGITMGTVNVRIPEELRNKLKIIAT